LATSRIHKILELICVDPLFRDSIILLQELKSEEETLERFVFHLGKMNLELISNCSGNKAGVGIIAPKKYRIKLVYSYGQGRVVMGRLSNYNDLVFIHHVERTREPGWIHLILRKGGVWLGEIGT
jgi:exonuclease III